MKIFVVTSANLGLLTVRDDGALNDVAISSLGFLAWLGLALGVALVEARQGQVIAKAWACVAAFFSQKETQRRLRHPRLLGDFLLSEPKAIKAGFKIVPVHALHIAMPISLWQ